MATKKTARKARAASPAPNGLTQAKGVPLLRMSKVALMRAVLAWRREAAKLRKAYDARLVELRSVRAMLAIEKGRSEHPQSALVTTLSARQVLKAIDSWAERRGRDSQCRELWDILTALRGPDDRQDQWLKEHSTGVVRWRTLHYLCGGYGMVSPEPVASARAQMDEVYEEERFSSGHFVEHQRVALKRLAQWEELDKLAVVADLARI